MGECCAVRRQRLEVYTIAPVKKVRVTPGRLFVQGFSALAISAWQ